MEKLAEFLESLDLCVIHNLMEDEASGMAIGNKADPSVGIFQFYASPWFKTIEELSDWAFNHQPQLELGANGEIEEVEP